MESLTDGAVHRDPVNGSTTRYYPFGDWRTEPTANLTDRGYTGHQHNNLGPTDLGLIYMNARYYIPATGRFASPDTLIPNLQNPQSFNRFSYVFNTPLNYIDPSGHYGVCFQQGKNNSDQKETALTQICDRLAISGGFGASEMYQIFTNDEEGMKMAIAWLNQMLQLYPSEGLFVLGYSYGGAGALEFAWLLNDLGGQTYKEQSIPNGVKIHGLIMIDPVMSYRKISSHHIYENTDGPFATVPLSVPDNVQNALNLYATENIVGAMWGLNPADAGIKNIDGAWNIGINANHCTIAYADCSKYATQSGSTEQNSSPSYESPNDPVNPNTLGTIRWWLRLINFETGYHG